MFAAPQNEPYHPVLSLTNISPQALATLCPSVNLDSEVIDMYLRYRFASLPASRRARLCVLSMTCTGNLLVAGPQMYICHAHLNGRTSFPEQIIAPIQKTVGNRCHYALVHVDTVAMTATYYDTDVASPDDSSVVMIRSRIDALVASMRRDFGGEAVPSRFDWRHRIARDGGGEDVIPIQQANACGGTVSVIAAALIAHPSASPSLSELLDTDVSGDTLRSLLERDLLARLSLFSELNRHVTQTGEGGKSTNPRRAKRRRGWRRRFPSWLARSWIKRFRRQVATVD